MRSQAHTFLIRVRCHYLPAKKDKCVNPILGKKKKKAPRQNSGTADTVKTCTSTALNHYCKSVEENIFLYFLHHFFAREKDHNMRQNSKIA